MRRVAVVLLVCVLAMTAAGAGWVVHIAGWRGLMGPRKRLAISKKVERTEERRKRGEYIFKCVAVCVTCHAPVDYSKHDAPYPPELLASGGGSAADRTLVSDATAAPNITPDMETGIGSWSDDQIARAIREGIGAHGEPLDPMMPYRFYREMKDEDAASVVVYLRSIPAVKRKVQRAKASGLQGLKLNRFPEPILSPVVSTPNPSQDLRGRYIAQLANCVDCHTPQDPEPGTPLPGLEFAGGLAMEGPWGKVASANITPDATGLGYATPEMFVQMIRNGVGRDHELNPVMPWHGYRGMSDEDLRDLFAYLKTLKPIKHKVSNTIVPTLCRVCGLRHGLGDQN
jgi:mono/diheme cytochrome c family protein